jgi:hypothetical protein
MASLKCLLELAFQTYLTQQVGGNIYKGHDNDDKAAPCVICQVESLEEEPFHSGNYNAACRIIVKGMAADGEDAFDALDESVRNALWTDTIHTDLQTDGLTVFGVAAAHQVTFGVEGDALTASHLIIVHCCNYTFTA